MKKALRYPLTIFNNNTVLRLVIHSAWIRFSLLTIAFFINYFDSALFDEYELVYNLTRGVFNTFFVVLVLGYFISKGKFCIISLMSFYSIVLIRANYFANLLNPYEYYEEVTISIISLAWLIILLEKLNRIVLTPLK